MSDTPDRDLARRDEVLELLFWLEGEGIGGNASLPGMARFLTCDEPELSRTLNDLVARGDVELDPERGEYRLTTVGRQLAGPRFADSFAEMLSQGHGECNDPECDCMQQGPAACQHAHL